jgi:hypothetical protein
MMRRVFAWHDFMTRGQSRQETRNLPLTPALAGTDQVLPDPGPASAQAIFLIHLRRKQTREHRCPTASSCSADRILKCVASPKSRPA